MLHRRKGLLCGVSPDIMRVTSDDEGERLLISSAGVWQAQDLLATLQDDTLRGVALADGELRYTAPELLTGRNADVRSDVFTMGVLAYEMATATLPYDGGVDAGAPRQHAARVSPPNPARCSRRCRRRRAPRSSRRLRPAPNERFATAQEFGQALLAERDRVGGPVSRRQDFTARPPSRAPAPQRRGGRSRD